MGWFEQNAPQPVAQSPGVAGPALQPSSPTQGGTDYRATFKQLFPGESLSPEQLAANEDKLKAAGFRLLGPNAAGQRSKIELPNGQIVDVIGGAGSGQNRSQWLVESGGGGGGMNVAGAPGFQVGSFTGGGQYPLSSVNGTGLAAPWLTPFNAPDPNSITNDKALQWQMGRGMDAIQRSAAAKGTLLTGGLLNKLQMQAQGIGSQYYGDVYNRKLGEYSLAHSIFGENQQNLFNRLGFMSGIGENAAAGVGNAQLGMGDARAQGSLQQGDIWGNAASGGAGIAGDIFKGLNHPPTPTVPTGTSYVPGTFYGPGQVQL